MQVGGGRAPDVFKVLGQDRGNALREAVAQLQSGLPNAVDRAFKILHTISYSEMNLSQVGTQEYK